MGRHPYPHHIIPAQSNKSSCLFGKREPLLYDCRPGIVGCVRALSHCAGSASSSSSGSSCTAFPERRLTLCSRSAEYADACVVIGRWEFVQTVNHIMQFYLYPDGQGINAPVYVGMVELQSHISISPSHLHVLRQTSNLVPAHKHRCFANL